MIYDIAIIGAGPAGLTAAVYACRAEKSVIVFEKLVAGGQIVNTPKISNYPATPGISGADWAKTLEKQAEDLGAEIRYDEVISIEKTEASAESSASRSSLFVIKTADTDFSAKTVIFAAGLVDRKMAVPGEEKFVGRGISYCATCDGAFYKGKTVAVVGGGNAALASALYLSDIAEKVYLVHRREEYRATEILQDKIAERKNIEPVLGFIPSGLITDNDKLVGLELKKNPVALDDIPNQDANSAHDNTASETTHTLTLDGIFVAIGHEPKNHLISDFADFDGHGYILTDENCQTATPGVFAAGDCRAKSLRQLVTATADGALAATSAIDLL